MLPVSRPSAGGLGSASKSSINLSHPATGAAVVLRHGLVQPENVTLEESPEIFRRGRNLVQAEKFAHEIHVRPPGEIDFFNAVVGVEFRGERFGKRLDARAAGVDERAVNVEQYESHHAPEVNRCRDGRQRGCRLVNKFLLDL